MPELTAMSKSELAESRETALSRLTAARRELASPTRVLVREGLFVQGGAFAAGFLDATVPELGGAPPSLVGGLVTAGAAIATKSPKLASAANGMLAPHSYRKGAEIGAGMKVRWTAR